MSGAMGPGPEVETHHHHHTGHHWLDIALSVSAIAISLMTAVLAFQHGHAMEVMVRQNERMVQANTWPYLTLYFSDADTDARPVFRLAVVNNGVGPAKVETTTIRYKGKPVASLFALAAAVARDAGIADRPAVLISDIGGVLPARQTVTILNVQAPLSSDALIAAFRAASPDAIEIGICYCSIFDECWTTELTGNAQPRAVKQCI